MSHATETAAAARHYSQAAQDGGSPSPAIRTAGIAAMLRMACGPIGATQDRAQEFMEEMFAGIGLTISHAPAAPCAPIRRHRRVASCLEGVA